MSKNTTVSVNEFNSKLFFSKSSTFDEKKAYLTRFVCTCDEILKSSDQFGDSLLHISVRLGLADACQVLLDCGAEVEAQDKVCL